MANYKAIGCISGNPLNGLCERMCLHVETVTDACRARRDNQTATVVLSDLPSGAPFTFVDASETGDVSFVVDSTCISNGDCRRVRGRLRVTLNVRFTDANGNCGCASGVLELARDLSLRVPTDNGANYRFDADAVLVCTNGAFISDSAVSLSYCIVETYRVLMIADVLVPTYGFAVYPDCTECDGCAELLNNRIFPERR
ncbi:MAG: hypothetical protein HFK09_04015 [Clostridia bacterium]|nr:hypothetical protein [Clostridia bacterium]